MNIDLPLSRSPEILDIDSMTRDREVLKLAQYGRERIG